MYVDHTRERNEAHFVGLVALQFCPSPLPRILLPIELTSADAQRHHARTQDLSPEARLSPTALHGSKARKIFPSTNASPAGGPDLARGTSASAPMRRHPCPPARNAQRRHKGARAAKA
jgi:hypothetical protein